MIVLPRVAWATKPLVTTRRLDHAVVCDGIVGRIVQIVRPLVDFVRPGLHACLGPLTVRLNTHHTVGDQDSHHFGLRNSGKILGDNEVDGVINVGQAISRMMFHEDTSVRANRLNVLPCCCDILGSTVEPVNQESVCRSKCRCQSALAATEVDNHAALDARGCQDLLRHLFW